MMIVKDVIEGPTLIVNADDMYTKTDLEHLSKHALAMLVTPISSARDNALMIEEGMVKGFGDSHFYNAGAYMVDERYFESNPVEIPVRDHKELSLPHTLIEVGKKYTLNAIITTEWMPVGTHEQLAEVRKFFKKKTAV